MLRNTLLNDDDSLFKLDDEYDEGIDFFNSTHANSSFARASSSINNSKKSANLFSKAKAPTFYESDEDEEEEEEDDPDQPEKDQEFINGNTLCFIYQSSKLACAFYDVNKKCLFYLNDLPENSHFELTKLIIADANPSNILTSSKSDANFIEFLKTCLTSRSAAASTDDKLEDSCSNNNPEEDDQDTENDSIKRQFVLMTHNDFNYELSKTRIFQIKSLEHMPDNMSDSEKRIFFSCLFNFDSPMAIKSIGALLKYLDKNSIFFDMDKNNTIIPIYLVKPLHLDKLCLLDANSFKSLQIFNEIDYNYAYRQTSVPSPGSSSRTSLNNKPNIRSITLYSLFLSKMQTKIGISKLRSFLMKPTRDLDILNERHKIVEFFYDSRNGELTDMVRAALKKCKFVSTILKRMRETRCKLSEWKRVFKTTQSLLAICNLSVTLNQMLNGKESHANAAPNSFECIVGSTAVSNSIHERETARSNVSSFYSMQLNDSKKNLFLRIHACNYGPRFEYLISLFENTVDMKASIQDNKCHIRPNISFKLDERKQIYAQLPEYLTEVAKEELDKYDLNSCNVMYIPQMGFLFVIKADSFFKNLSTADSVNWTSFSELDTSDTNNNNNDDDTLNKLRTEFEFLNELKFVFKSNSQYYYKNTRMISLDQQFGDISSDINDLEAELMDQLQEEFIKCSHYYANMIDFCSELDTLLAFGLVAREYNYTKPHYERKLNETFINISEGRHPLVEIYKDNAMMFIPNDTQSGCSGADKIKLITSPNASGKTIYLKQIGLIVFMSLIGSYVPAREACIGDIDRIFTRINSTDSITEGQSTFSADVKQIGEALNSSTSKSLILIDEFGKTNGNFILI